MYVRMCRVTLGVCLLLDPMIRRYSTGPKRKVRNGQQGSQRRTAVNDDAGRQRQSNKNEPIFAAPVCSLVYLKLGGGTCFWSRLFFDPAFHQRAKAKDVVIDCGDGADRCRQMLLLLLVLVLRSKNAGSPTPPAVGPAGHRSPWHGSGDPARICGRRIFGITNVGGGGGVDNGSDRKRSRRNIGRRRR